MADVIFFDTTLRDGEQAPGNTQFDFEKEEIAHGLAEAGVGVIEAGFPASSDGDFESVRNVAAKMVERYGERSPVIAGLSMATEKNVRRAGEAVAPATAIGKGRIHTFIASSQIHADRKLRKTQAQILDMAVNAVKLARTYTNDVEFSPEDASRTGIEFLCEISEATAKVGATTINIPDTTGYAVPEEYGQMIKRIAGVVSPHGAIVSTHCHNDLGRAVDNSLAALLNGARQVEVAVNGIGERAGNASLEQIVMNLITRRDYYGARGITTNFDSTQIGALSRIVSMSTGSWPSSNAPIVGSNAFSHQAGIHQDGMIKHASTYEIMSPESVGWVGERNVVGKHSGEAGVAAYLKEIGYDDVSLDIVRKIRDKIKEVTVRQKHAYDHDVRKIAGEYGLKPRKPVISIDLDNIDYTRHVRSDVKIPVNWNEVASIISGSGDGSIHAAYKAIKEYTGNGIELVGFRVNAIGTGEKAIGEARVTIAKQGRLYVARGGHNDTILASTAAYVNAINRALVSE